MLNVFEKEFQETKGLQRNAQAGVFDDAAICGDFEIRRQSELYPITRVCEVCVLSPRQVAPGHAKRICHRQECMGADRDPPALLSQRFRAI